LLPGQGQARRGVIEAIAVPLPPLRAFAKTYWEYTNIVGTLFAFPEKQEGDAGCGPGEMIREGY